jgi:small subunit ribosomal protein S6
MQSYEVMIIIDPDADETRQDEIIGRVRELVLGDGGAWSALDPWGRRKLSFEIDKKGEGFYWLIRFDATAAALLEIERVLRITDDVIRHKATVVRSRRASRTAEPAGA